MEAQDLVLGRTLNNPMLDLKVGSTFGSNSMATQSTGSISTEVQLTEPQGKPAVPVFPQRGPAVVYSLIPSLKEPQRVHLS